MKNAMEAILHIRLPQNLMRTLKARARGQHRRQGEQIWRYLEIAMIAEDNPELPFAFIEGILEAKAEVEVGLTEELDWSVE